MSNKKIQVVDFFCGAGGLTQGLNEAGLQVILGIDNDASVKQTFEENNDAKFLEADLRQLNFSTIKKYLKLKKSDSLVFVGCAPCQPFSKINLSESKDSKEDLLLEFGQAIAEFKPDFVMSENVPAIKNRKVFERFISLLKRQGYQYTYAIVNSFDYGVPQNRKRLVLLATRHSKKLIFPRPPEVHVTVRDAISHYPPIKAGESHPAVPNHSCRGLSERNLKRIRSTPIDGGIRISWSKRLWLECHKGCTGFKDVYGRMSWDKPGPTITTKSHSLSNGRFGHPEQDRAISLREAAALQTFPDDYFFYGSTETVSRHIGNAVPPSLARYFGEFIYKYLNN